MTDDVCPASGKTIYKHYQEAMSAVASFQKRSKSHRTPRTAYRCEDCGKWHVTSFSPDKSRALQKAKKARR